MFLSSFASLAAAQNCNNTSIGRVPLDDLGPDTYQGFVGGLYLDGSNERPPLHDAAGRALALQVVPLDRNGAPSPGGLIGLAAIGFSLTNMDWDTFITMEQGDTSLNPALVLVNATEAGKDAHDLVDTFDSYWTQIVPAAVRAAGLTMAQVEVVWMLEGDRELDEPFPQNAQVLEGWLATIIHHLHDLFPNLKIAFLDPPHYMGYSASIRYEPKIYEQGFSFQWLIGRQILGDPLLNFDPAQGLVAAPWLSWGIYPWADGIRTRSDGLEWECADYLPDGVHQSAQGQLKAAERLAHLFKSDPAATPWFLASGAGGCGHAADVDLYGDGTLGTAGVPRIFASWLPTVPSTHPLAIEIAEARPGEPGVLFVGIEPLAPGAVPFGGGSLLLEPLWTLPLLTDAQGAASVGFGDILDDPQLCDLDLFSQAAIADPRGLNGELALTPGLLVQFGD